VNRFRTLSFAPFETRRILRDRLGRFLPIERWTGPTSRQPAPATDESVLKLLLDLRIEFQSDEHRARLEYEISRKPHPNALPFEALLQSGWIRVVFGRVHSALNINDALRRADEDTRTLLLPVLGRGNQRRFILNAHSVPELEPVVSQLRNAPQDVHHLQCATPSWVIARLWDRAPASLSLMERLRFWLDRRDLLQDCILAPSSVWDEPSAEAFRATAFEALESDPALLSWDAFRDRLLVRSALLSGQDASDFEKHLGATPSTYVDRHLWANQPGWERSDDALDTCGDLWHLVNLLLREIEDSERSAAPHPVARRLFELAAERPELLDFITLRLRQMPIVLADMLLVPRLAALACMLVVGWTSGGGAWERELRDQDDRSTRSVAFADALAVVVYFVEARSLAPAELAALVSWFHQQANARPYMTYQAPKVDERMLQAVRAKLAELSPGLLRAVAESCMIGGRPVHVGSSSFSAALDVIGIGTLSDVVEPETFVAPYITSIRTGDHALSALGIDARAARALVRVAQRSPADRWVEFLSPLDIRARLAAAQKPGANRFMIRDDVARSIRTHVRILCRALVSWDVSPPLELVEALIRVVRSGALLHEEKGRVAAFSARHEADAGSSRSERPIAADLGETLVSLADPYREQLLVAILETDEPLMLAQLVDIAPHSTRTQIRARLDALTPTEAGELSSLTDVHARIEALLDAGAADAAASFIAAERNLKTFGMVPGRELARLRMTMRVLLQRRDYSAIVNAEVPMGLGDNDASAAGDTLEFYKSLAELSKPDGDLDAAERGFKHLQGSRPEIAAYATNLLAARINKLLPRDLFGRVQGGESVSAREALADAESTMDRWIGANDDDRAAHNGNRALLLLAIGHPESAYELLQSTPSSKRQARIASYAAVALSRMGREEDALAALESAASVFGETDDLRAARAHVHRDAPLAERATAVLTHDPFERIKVALFDLIQLDPVGQGTVLHGAPGGFDEMVVNHVRSAAASVVALVPMMKDIQLDSCEDDLTALLQAVLASRLEFFGWSVADQSKGGFTAKGNPGERDIVLRKGSIVLCALEAVVCDRPATHEWTRRELTSHFQKLLGYSNCRVFFHLTYSYVAEPGDVLTELRRIAQEESPNGFSLTRLQDLPLVASTPIGFWATYDSQLGEVKVVFLLLDMDQHAQRDAARAASQSNPRQKRDVGRQPPS